MKQAAFLTAPRLRALLLVSACAALSGCGMLPATGDDLPEPGVMEATRQGPEGAAPGTCWGRTVSPAVVERISERVEVKPAKINPDGTIASPPVYRTEDRQVIVTPRRDNWFETLCPDALTPEFVSSLQRALQARMAYDGPITGVMDEPTRAAISAFQRQSESGLNSTVLSLETARQLGLSAVPRSELE